MQGPVPAALYHRFVEFKPFVKGMFDRAGLRGHILNSALHHQHARIYNYSTSTCYGAAQPRTREATMQFLNLAHFGDGLRLFTYVLTLDGLLRFTETGKEFGIDMLSKHTMHSDVNLYIAFSGEFLIRRTDGTVEEVAGEAAERDPGDFELVIDNDSGTYRPNAALLPQLQEFLEANLPGLRVAVRDCADEKYQRLKAEQRERKKALGGAVAVYQPHSNSSSDNEGWSSSDEEALGERVRGKKSKHGRAYDALEDPADAIHYLRGKHELEEKKRRKHEAEARKKAKEDAEASAAAAK